MVGSATNPSGQPASPSCHWEPGEPTYPVTQIVQNSRMQMKLNSTPGKWVYFYSCSFIRSLAFLKLHKCRCNLHLTRLLCCVIHQSSLIQVTNLIFQEARTDCMLVTSLTHMVWAWLEKDGELHNSSQQHRLCHMATQDQQELQTTSSWWSGLKNRLNDVFSTDTEEGCAAIQKNLPRM